MLAARLLVPFALIALLAHGALQPSPAIAQDDASAGAASNPEVARWLEKGQDALAKGKPGRAVKAYQKAVEASGGQSPRALHGLARAALFDKDFEVAISAAEPLLEMTSAARDRLVVFQILGTAHYEIWRTDPDRHLPAAEDALRQSLTLARALGDTTGTPAYSLAQVLSDAGEVEEAVGLLRGFPYGTAPDSVASAARRLLCKVRGPSRPEDLDPAPVVFENSGLTEPRLVSEFPKLFTARLARGQAIPSAELVIDRDGCVAEVANVEGMDRPDEALLSAYATYVFHPALESGEPVAVRFMTRPISPSDLRSTEGFEIPEVGP